MQKFLTSLFLSLIIINPIFAADTTFSSRHIKKEAKTKMPVNLYVPATTTQTMPQTMPQTVTQPMQGMDGQTFVPQINFVKGENSDDVKIENPYFDRTDASSTPTIQSTPATLNLYAVPTTKPQEFPITGN